MVFVESQPFTRRLRELAGRAEPAVLSEIQNSLLQDPLRGRLVQGLSGIRKARVGNPSRGKGSRGGFRYLYLYLEHRGHIHLLYLLDKDEQEDLSSSERRALRSMVEQLKREWKN